MQGCVFVCVLLQPWIFLISASAAITGGQTVFRDVLTTSLKTDLFQNGGHLFPHSGLLGLYSWPEIHK